jgi:CRP-like cAMP-binding protein
MATALPELKAFLLETPFFGGLSDTSLEVLAGMLVERQFAAGGVIFAEGDAGRSMFVVQSGTLSVTRDIGVGRSMRLSGLGPGDFFGEMTLIAMQNRSATVTAETSCVLYELAARSLYAFYKADVHAYVLILQNINRELCRRLCRADERSAALQLSASACNTDGRVAPAASPARRH